MNKAIITVVGQDTVDLDKLGEEIGVRIRCQREEIFTKMHRV